MKKSLVSVTFRKNSPEELCAFAVQAGLDAIEWGGDIHVPAGDIAAAAKAVQLCRENGLAINAYGSYYRATEGEDFTPILQTALALKTPVVRVWAGKGIRHSSLCTEQEREVITQNLRRAVAAASEYGLTLATECHPNTLTDEVSSTKRLLEEVPGLYTYWQPRYDQTTEQCLHDIALLGEKIVNIHVFQRGSANEKLPLADGADCWKQYLAAAKALTKTAYVGMEFVAGDTLEQFLADADTLRAIFPE